MISRSRQAAYTIIDVFARYIDRGMAGLIVYGTDIHAGYTGAVCCEPVVHPAQFITVIKVLSMCRWLIHSGLREPNY